MAPTNTITESNIPNLNPAVVMSETVDLSPLPKPVVRQVSDELSVIVAPVRDGAEPYGIKVEFLELSGVIIEPTRNQHKLAKGDISTAVQILRREYKILKEIHDTNDIPKSYIRTPIHTAVLMLLNHTCPEEKRADYILEAVMEKYLLDEGSTSSDRSPEAAKDILCIYLNGCMAQPV